MRQHIQTSHTQLLLMALYIECNESTSYAHTHTSLAKGLLAIIAHYVTYKLFLIRYTRTLWFSLLGYDCYLLVWYSGVSRIQMAVSSAPVYWPMTANNIIYRLILWCECVWCSLSSYVNCHVAIDWPELIPFGVAGAIWAQIEDSKNEGPSSSVTLSHCSLFFPLRFGPRTNDFL